MFSDLFICGAIVGGCFVATIYYLLKTLFMITPPNIYKETEYIMNNPDEFIRKGEDDDKHDGANWWKQ